MQVVANPNTIKMTAQIRLNLNLNRFEILKSRANSKLFQSKSDQHVF